MKSIDLKKYYPHPLHEGEKIAYNRVRKIK